MFFTQEDYKKIQQWLTSNSVKDTEFNEADIPLNGNEIVSIVQGNQNKKVFLRDLVSQIFNLRVSDFINITDKYDAPNISLEEAIRLIPSRARKEGQVITFLDREDHWHIYQFKGVLNQWNVLDTWEDLFDWEKLIINSILPDEEDLTKSPADANGNSYLSLKDREYNPEDFSGLGRVILRKNIIEIKDPIYGKVKKNILYQDMFTQSNTVYEIRYDFDLNNQTITIPENCILKYEGGSLNNGHIVYQNTKIQGIESLNNITTEGVFVVIDAVSDEEDLHNNNGVLKFADREYNPNAFSGLGKIILRKNIKEGKNILTQELINKPNTIYIIQYDYDLNDAEITIPEGCVLDFQGGSLNNGTIVGNKTSIISPIEKIFSTNIELKGVWSVTESYPEWFGAKGNAENDDRLAIQKTLDSFKYVRFLDKTYLLGSYSDVDNLICLNVPQYCHILGSSKVPPYVDNQKFTFILSDSIIPKTIINCEKGNNIENISVLGNARENENLQQTGVKVKTNSKLVNVSVNRTYYGIESAGFLISIIQCCVGYTTYGFFIHGNLNNSGTITVQQTSVLMQNCYVGNSLKSAYYIYGIVYSNIISCAADGCGMGKDSGVSTDSEVSHVYWFRNCECVNVLGCGFEVGAKAVRIQSCVSVSLRNMYWSIASLDRLETNFDFTEFVKLTYSGNIIFDNIRIPTASIIADKPYIMYFENSANSIYAILQGEFSRYKEKIKYAGLTGDNHAKRVLVESNGFTYGNEPNDSDVFYKGFNFYNTSNNRPIWADGTNWRNALGEIDGAESYSKDFYSIRAVSENNDEIRIKKEDLISLLSKALGISNK